MSTSDGNTLCPEDEGDSWQYWDGSCWQSGGVEVTCASTPTPYQVLVENGAACAAGLHITSAAECEEAIAAANAAIGKPGSTYDTVSTVEYATSPKGCSTGCFDSSRG